MKPTRSNADSKNTIYISIEGEAGMAIDLSDLDRLGMRSRERERKKEYSLEREKEAAAAAEKEERNMKIEEYEDMS